ncbi:MAG: glycosyltransferase family 4 protein [Planctomycetota bacterium]|nr:glycosyltransferase family 4 protein [Planctomycetota bacterium]
MDTPKTPLRILVIVGAHLFPNRARPTAGGFFANLLLRLRRLSERVVVVVPTAYVPAWFRKIPRLASYAQVKRYEVWNGIEVYRPPYFSIRSRRHMWFQSRSFALAAAPLCESLHARHRFDLVLGNGFGAPAHAAQYIARQLRRRSVCWAIGSDVHTLPRLSDENRRLLRHNVRHSSIVLTTSEALRRDILALSPDARNVHTFYRGIDLDDLRLCADRATARAAFGLAADRTYMLTAGDVHRNKGSEEFYSAFRSLAGRRPGLAAMWIGDGDETANLRRRAQEDGLADRFTITGKVPRPEVLRYMRAADVMAFASHAEGLPNVVMEAMACGLPVVATRVGGTPEIIADGVTGLLVPAQDGTALADGVVRLLGDRDRSRRMGNRARAFIHTYFDVDRNAPVLVSVLERIAAGGLPEAPFPPCANVPPGRLPIHFADGQPPLEP